MKVLTANRLSDGEAVWLDADGRWAEEVAAAEIAGEEAAAARLREAGDRALANNEVVDVNLIDVEIVDGAIRPVRLRERIRAAGPTIHADLGKQARARAAKSA